MSIKAVIDYITAVTDIWLICHPVISSTSVQMVNWWWGCQTCVVMDVLSSCSLAVPSLSRPWTTCGMLAQGVVAPQLQFSSSPSLPPRAASGSAGALRPAMTTIAYKAPAFTSYTCTVDLLSLRALTVVQQVDWLVPLTGCRWTSACLRLPHLPHLLSSHHTSMHLAAYCAPLPSSIPALSQSDGENHNRVVLFTVCPVTSSLIVLVFAPCLKKPGQKVHLLNLVKKDWTYYLCWSLLYVFLNPLFKLRHLNSLSYVECVY